MAFEFKFPDVGEGITEGEIVKWRVKVGDTVKAEQVIGDIETDKAIVEIPCPKAGVILKINHKVGETINVGEVLVVIGKKGESLEKKKPVVEKKKKKPVSKPKKEDSKVPYTGSVIGFLEEADDAVSGKKQVHKKVHERVRATLRVRKLAQVLKVDINTVTGSGPNGRISEEDVKNAATKVKIVKEHGKVKRVPFKGVRKSVALKMVKAHQTTVSVTNMYDADVTKLWDVRKKEKVKAEKKNVKLTFLPFIIIAAVNALKKNPVVNSSLDEGELLLKQYYNIGFAVDTEEGLLVPVIKNADKKSILIIAKELSVLSGKARERKLSLDDMKGGSFSISNLGSIGVKYFTPIINYPESAILGVGRIEEKARIVDGEVVPKKIMPLSFSYDHRIIDGATASRFMLDLISELQS